MKYSQDELDQFVNHYIAAALFTSSDDSDSEYEYLDANYGPEDIEHESLATIRVECAQFLDAYAAHIKSGCLRADKVLGDRVYTAFELAGHDFWLTRCGHGCGFWEDDRWTESIGEVLTEASQSAGARDLYIGDDGGIYYGEG